MQSEILPSDDIIFSLPDAHRCEDGTTASSEELLRHQLYVSEQRFAALARATGQIVWTTKADGLPSDFRAWCSFTGQGAQTIAGWGWLKAVHPDDLFLARRQWAEALKSGNLFLQELRIRRADGEYRIFTVRAAPVPDEQGKPQQWIGVCTDITEQRLAQQQAQTALEDARKRMDEFFVLATHALRTPLASIKPNMVLIQRWAQKQENTSAPFRRIRDLLNRVQEQTARLENLIDSVIDFAHLQEDEITFHYTSCSLEPLIERVIQQHRLAWPGRTITYERTEVGRVFIDAERIKQVLTQLLANALHFAPAAQPIVVAARRTGACVCVKVQDGGPGVPVEEQERIWERFYQAPGIPNQQGAQSGLGLGLAICRMIMMHHSGQIGIANNNGQGTQGTTFWFTLPVAGNPNNGA